MSAVRTQPGPDRGRMFHQNCLSRIVQRFRVLLRAVGLSLITCTQENEPRKVLIYRSRKAALSHSAIHLVPSLVSILVIVFNFRGYFIGSELEGGRPNTDGLKLGLLQFAAKLQVQPSSSQIELSYNGYCGHDLPDLIRDTGAAHYFKLVHCCISTHSFATHDRGRSSTGPTSFRLVLLSNQVCQELYLR